MKATDVDTPVVRPARNRVVLVGLRALGTVTLLVTLYYTLPLSVRPAASTLATLLLGLAGITALIIWQIRAIVRAPHPGLRALETLALVIPTYLLIFAAGYFLASQADPTVFSEALTRTDSLYFTVTVFATVGFGDITPVSEGTRIVVAVQMLANLLVLGLVLQAILDAVRRGQQRGRNDSVG